MRGIYIILLFTMLSVTIGCKSHKNAAFTSANVAYVSNTGSETITLRSTDMGSNKEKAIQNAQKLAFQNLFSGASPALHTAIR